MRFVNSKFTADYPLYGANFIQSNAQKATLLVAGGGGEGKNGIPNMITSYRFVAQTGEFDKLQEIELPNDDDSPTAMDASIQTGVVLVGCNENSEKIKSGKGNNHLRKYNMDLTLQLEPVETTDLFRSSNPDEYTKVIEFSSDGKLVGVSSSKETEVIIKIIDGETLEEKFEINDVGKEVKDISFAANGKYFAYITPNSLEIISTVTGKSITRLNKEFDTNKLNLSKIKFINNDSLLIVATKHDHGDKRHSGIVLIKVSVKNGKAAIAKSHLLTNKFKGITAMDLNEENDLLTLATSEYSVLIVKLSNFDIKGTFSQIHSFAVTKITISPNGKYVASVSAANTIHMIQIPGNFKYAMSNRKETFQLWASVLLLIFAAIFYKMSTENKDYVKEYVKTKIAEQNIQLPDYLQNIITGYMRMTNMNQVEEFAEEIGTQELFNQTTLFGTSATQELVNQATSVATAATEEMVDQATSVATAATQEIVEQATSVASAATSVASSATQKLVDQAISVASAVTQEVINQAPSAASAAASVASAVTQEVVNHAPSAASAAASVASAVTQEVINQAPSAASAVTQEVVNHAPSAASAAASVASAVTQEVINQAPSAASAAASVASAVTQEVVNHAPSAASAAASVASAVTQEVINQAPSAASAAASVASAVTQEVVNHAPSAASAAA